MEDIDTVVRDICQGCAGRGIRVPEVLAAFVARTILENDPVRFSPDKELSAEDIDGLIWGAIGRLTERDDPALETMKMQVAFDSTYARLDDEVEMGRRKRSERRRALVRAIVAVRPRGATDFETLTALYRQIFSYLLFASRGICVGDTNAEVATERAVEREVAAALESVFPRIGLKSFVMLSGDEKKAQLEELARIVTGIRLFNRENGKGGAGLKRVEEAVGVTVSDLREALDSEQREQDELTARYQETLVHCHLRQPPGSKQTELARWALELANRRQYSAYLTSLAEDTAASLRRVRTHKEAFSTEMDELQALVGGRASVPKEHVYPKFDAIAKAWFALDEEMLLVEARLSSLETLHAFRDSYTTTLNAHNPLYRAALLEARSSQQQQQQDTGAVDQEAALAAAVARQLTTEEVKEAPIREAPPPPASLPAEEAAPAPAQTVAETLQSKLVLSDPLEDDDDFEPPVRLSVETTPEFMQLPLEYQGFCGWTVASRHGLLLPGKPALGVVRYRGACYVFAHAVAMEAFMENPEEVRRGVLEAARRMPELVHLLRIHDQFPGTSIHKMLARQRQKARANNDMHTTVIDEDPESPHRPAAGTRDAATETPLHFVEKHIDPSYEWNDWSMRRRALQLAHLKKCATTSMQTDGSHFRQSNSTQIYLPALASTQTRKDAASEPESIFKSGTKFGNFSIRLPA